MKDGQTYVTLATRQASPSFLVMRGRNSTMSSSNATRKTKLTEKNGKSSEIYKHTHARI